MRNILALFLLFSQTLIFGQGHWHKVSENERHLQSVTAHGYGWAIEYNSSGAPPHGTHNFSSIEYDFTVKKNVFDVSGQWPTELKILASGNPFTVLLFSRNHWGYKLWYVNKEKSPIEKVIMNHPNYIHGPFAYNKDLYFLREDNDFYKIEDDSLVKLSSFEFKYHYDAQQTIHFTTPNNGFILLIDSIGEFLGSTVDSGKTWTYNRLDSAQPWQYVETRMINFLDPANGIIVSDSGKIYLTSDSGTTWQIDTIKTDPQLRYNFIANNGMSYYLTGDSTNKVYRSDDKGITWQAIPVTNDIVRKIINLSCPQWDRCYLIDLIGNLYMNQELTGLDESKSNNTEISLYPNPSDNEINILGIENTDRFLIELYNLNGKVIARYANKLKINTSQLTEGLYFLRIISDFDSVVRKFIKN